MILSPARHRVATLVAAGLPRGEIARRLDIRAGTVDAHRLAAMRALGVTCRRSLAVALVDATPGVRVRVGRYGFRRGDAVRITGGRYAGRAATYCKAANSRQISVAIGGGVVAITARFVERVAC